MAKKTRGNDLFAGGVFSEIAADTSGTVEQMRLLSLLRDGPKHHDWLRGVFEKHDKLVAGLRASGHVIRKISLAGRRWDSVFALLEKGKYCGVKEGQSPKIVGGA